MVSDQVAAVEDEAPDRRQLGDARGQGDDRIGLTIVASALAVADPNHGDWTHDAIIDVFGIFSEDRDNAMRLCEDLVREADDRVALGAGQLHEILAEINPVLRPA